MKVILITGPTATGKTDLSIELAQNFNAEIVNFDSLLFYQEINIGTAKPSLSDRKKVPHHMIDIRSIRHPMNAADYAKEALPQILEILKRKNIILTGGSGFYLQALLKGMYDSPTTPKEISFRSDELFKNYGIAPFLDILKKEDPKSFKLYHENDHYRVRRAVEHLWSHGLPLSSARCKKDEENAALGQSNVHGWDLLHVYLDIPKEEHLKIIIERTKKMLELGLLEEVKALLSQGFTGLEKPLQSIGYKEVIDLEFGVHKNILECQNRIVISTRQLAKSQRTWFKRDHSRIIFNPLTQREDIFLSVKNFLAGPKDQE